MANSDISIHELPNGVLTESSLFVTSDAGQGTTYASAKHSAGEIGEYLAGEAEFNALTPENKTIIGSINELADASLSAVVTGTLTAGQTSVTLSDARIKTDSLLVCYTNPFGVNPTNMTASSGSVTITFEEQSVDISVAVEIRGESGGGGGGSSEPEFTSTLIGEKGTGSDYKIYFTDVIENYDFIKFKVALSEYTHFEVVTTPETINNCFLYSSNSINFNQTKTTNFATYQKTSDSEWMLYNHRTCYVTEVYGLTCTNKTVTKTEIYNRQAIASTPEITIISQTSLYDYDYLFMSSCTGSFYETQPCNEIFMMKENVFTVPGQRRTMFTNAYGDKIGVLTVSQYAISAWFYHFYVQGIKFT